MNTSSPCKQLLLDSLAVVDVQISQWEGRITDAGDLRISFYFLVSVSLCPLLSISTWRKRTKGSITLERQAETSARNSGLQLHLSMLARQKLQTSSSLPGDAHHAPSVEQFGVLSQKLRDPP